LGAARGVDGGLAYAGRFPHGVGPSPGRIWRKNLFEVRPAGVDRWSLHAS